MSFKVKLVLVILLINIFVVSLTLYFRSKQIEISIKERMIFRTQIIADIIVYSIDDETKLDRLIIGEYTEFIIKEPEIQYIAFFNKKNQLIEVAGEYNKKEFIFQTDNIFRITDNVYDVYKEIKGKDNKKIGSIIIGFPMQSLKDIIRKNLIIGIFLWAGATVLIIILNYFSLSYFLKPIKYLYESTKQIAKKNFSNKVPILSKDELGIISKQFNIMSEELATFYNKLKNKVKEATSGLEKANKKLREMDKKKSEFVAIVAHDLRTPITSIMGFADTLTDKEFKLTIQEKEEYLNIIRYESHRLSRLIADFLDISKIEDNRMGLDIKKKNVSELIRKALNSINTKAKGVTLSLESEENFREVYLDADRITQVIQNLIGNALKYSPQNSVIKVLLKQNPSEIRINVIDHGPGIPDEYKEKIFEKFYRGDDDISKKERGSGLGLAIAKSIIEMHGGRIWVEDATPSGSCFIITLPVKD